MRPDLIYGGSVAAGQTIQYQVAKGHVNGLVVFSSTDVSNAKVTIKRNTPGRCHVLSASVPAKHFARISDLRNGATSTGLLANLIRKAFTTDPDAAGTKVALYTAAEFKAVFNDVVGPQDFGAFYIDLGSLYLGPSNELEVVVSFPTAANEVRLYTVSHQRQPDRMIQTDILSDRETHLSSIRALYISAETQSSLLNMAADGSYLSALDVLVQIEDGSDNTLCDVSGFVATATVLGRAEGAAQTAAAQVYATPDGVPSSAYVKVTGADASKVAIIAHRIVVDPNLVTKNTLGELKKLRERVENLERTEPATAKALRHSGDISKSTELAQVEMSAERPTSLA